MKLLDQLAGRYVEDGECLRWTAGCVGGRHPAMSTERSKGAMVRRLLWEEKHGPIPAGKIIRCTCETVKCINVEHFELTTFQKLAKQLGAIGVMSGPVRTAKIAAANRERHPFRKTTQDVARAIRESDEPGVVLAKRYGLTESLVSKIRTGKVRREVGANPWAGLGDRAGA